MHSFENAKFDGMKNMFKSRFSILENFGFLWESAYLTIFSFGWNTRKVEMRKCLRGAFLENW